MGRAALVAVALLASGLAVSAAWTPLAAQQAAAPEEQPDSARQRILERLRRLARPPGSDSVIYTEDSLRLAAAEAGNRPTAAQGMDSVALTLVGMPGYALTEYSGGSADFEAQDRVLTLHAAEGARARVVQEGNEIQADSSITFDQTTGRVRPRGMTTFTPPEGDAVDSPEMVYDLNQGRGTALDARTSYTQAGARWLVRGDMPYAAQDSSFMSHAQFTSCDLEVPHYHFETDEIKIVGGSVLVATGVRLYFADVPVFWLPFIAQSLSSGRSSGLLTPRFSVNDIVRTSNGYQRNISNIGFYWAMSDYSDALLAADWFSNNYFSLTASGQYKVNRLFLNGDMSVRNYWQSDGSKQLSFDTRHAWKMDERTDLRVSARYAKNDFVRQYSFNPREAVQSIDSEGGINRRFGWGALSLAANRKQYLSDDRTEWTLPSASLSLSPITLFRAPPSEAHFWNNMTWGGSSSFTRSTVDRAAPAAFTFGNASTAKSTGYVRSSLSLGNLGFSQSVNVTQDQTRDVPLALLIPGVTEAPPELLLPGSPARSIAQSTLNWSTSVSYQQRLIGSTTLTPHVSVSGQMFRADTSSLAQSFVSAPSRVSVGAQLKTDIYGFYPGFAGFQAIRHKLSPSFDYQWSPEKTPNDLQRQVFGSRVLQPQNSLSLTLNQTFEAKREENEDEEGTTQASDSAAVADSLALPPLSTARGGEPRRLPQADIVNLLSLRTSVVKYDFVEADSAGSFLQGFQTTVLSNQISSDLLRGLSISTDHELFDDKLDSKGKIASRRFAPHLSQVNLSFSLGSSSSIFKWLGLFGAGRESVEEPAPATDPFAEPGATDESTVIPTGPAISPAERRPAQTGSTGTWTANFSYSLQRPRTSDTMSQMLQASFRLQPTLNWALSWRTAYDLEAHAFNDHSIQLTRDLHRWQATFDFLQTATGNWSFRFEVSLTDNRDLKFDYDQRNLDLSR